MSSRYTIAFLATDVASARNFLFLHGTSSILGIVFFFGFSGFSFKFGFVFFFIAGQDFVITTLGTFTYPLLVLHDMPRPTLVGQ